MDQAPNRGANDHGRDWGHGLDDFAAAVIRHGNAVRGSYERYRIRIRHQALDAMDGIPWRRRCECIQCVVESAKESGFLPMRRKILPA